MGTTHEWIEVVIWGGFFAIAMTLSSSLRKAPDSSKTGWSWVDGVSSALLGLFFGVGSTFRWRALHPPFVFILLLAICGVVAIRMLAPLRPPPTDKSPHRQ
jgi:hypothetical protein